MNYYTIPPPPRLARYVRCFWVYEGEASSDKPYIYRGLADDCTELLFHYRGVFDRLADGSVQRSFEAGISAQTRKYKRFVVDKNWGIFGCYLYPFALPRFFSFPSSDFTDTMTDFHSVLGREGKELEEKILAATDNHRRVEVLAHFLEKQLERNPRAEPLFFASIAHIIDTRKVVNVPELTCAYSLSSRQFERKFKEFSGFSPKMFARINRFQAALKQYGRRKSLTDIAYDCGYYDQSHFINEFQEFSGYNPKVYFSGKAEGSEYLQA